MELIDLFHRPEENSVPFDPDLFVAASGYETRSIIFPKSVESIKAKKIALAFKEYPKALSRPVNDRYFSEHTYDLIPVSSFEEPDFHTLLRNFDTRDLKVLVDISVMNRLWFHSLLKELHKLSEYDSVMIRLVYCQTLYEQSISYRRKFILDSFHMADSEIRKGLEEKPVALLLGLGLESGKAIEICDMIKPDFITLMHADSIDQKDYVRRIYLNNHELISKTEIRHLFEYPVKNTEAIYKKLIDIILPLRRDYQVIVVPQGPKIFSLVAMILQISYPDIEIRFPRYIARKVKDRKPLNDFITIDLQFGAEQDVE